MFISDRTVVQSLAVSGLISLLAACGDGSGGNASSSGSIGDGAGWIDQPFVDCSEMQAEPRNMMAREVEQAHWPAFCGTQGKAYADEWRCKGERVQIKCE